MLSRLGPDWAPVAAQQTRVQTVQIMRGNHVNGFV